MSDRAHKSGLCCNRVLHFSARRGLPDATHVALERDRQHELVTRLDHPLEARIVDTNEKILRAGRIVRLFREG